MVAEVRPEYPSDWPAIKAVAAKLGIGSAETLRKWVRQVTVAAGRVTRLDLVRAPAKLPGQNQDRSSERTVVPPRR
jgi:transposase-like protein